MSYVIENRNPQAPTCFPEGYDTTDLIEITVFSDNWAKFFDPRNNRVIDCKNFFDQYQAGSAADAPQK